MENDEKNEEYFELTTKNAKHLVMPVDQSLISFAREMNLHPYTLRKGIEAFSMVNPGNGATQDIPNENSLFFLSQPYQFRKDYRDSLTKGTTFHFPDQNEYKTFPRRIPWEVRDIFIALSTVLEKKKDCTGNRTRQLDGYALAPIVMDELASSLASKKIETLFQDYRAKQLFQEPLLQERLLHLYDNEFVIRVDALTKRMQNVPPQHSVYLLKRVCYELDLLLYDAHPFPTRTEEATGKEHYDAILNMCGQLMSVRNDAFDRACEADENDVSSEQEAPKLPKYRFPSGAACQETSKEMQEGAWIEICEHCIRRSQTATGAAVNGRCAVPAARV